MRKRRIARGVCKEPITIAIDLPPKPELPRTTGTSALPFEKVKHLMSKKPLDPPYRGPPPADGPGGQNAK